ncbi:helix-turn-helix transcriptional regulator [Amaricoccus macauensis]|uniref:helix-turn-helix transcriptional regulator n=1 Tax=Amaricoccus macauensis TaxID=57001 RepID=UPI003C7C425D
MTLQHLNQIELSRRWRLSSRTLERWRSEEKGPPYLKIGGRILYRIEDIEAFEARELRMTGAKPTGQTTGSRSAQLRDPASPEKSATREPASPRRNRHA